MIKVIYLPQWSLTTGILNIEILFFLVDANSG
jgi:hypothetical protein